MIRWVVNALAVLGAAAVLLTGALYVQGWRATRNLDPKASEVIGEFARRAFEADAASAGVVKMPLAKGVTLKDAVESLKLRANQRNVKLLTRLPFHKEIKAQTGKDFPYTEIFLLCDAVTGAELLRYNMNFLAYMPCTVSIFEDAQGQGWVISMDLSLLIHGGPDMDPALKERVLAVQESILDIMAAAAAGGL